MTLGRDANMVVQAESLYSSFVEYKKAGFTEEQTMSIILTVVEASIYAMSRNPGGQR